MKGREWGRVAVLVLLVLILNTSLGLYRWLPDVTLWNLLAFTVESVVIVGAVLLLARLKNRVVAAGLTVTAATLSSILLLFGIGEAFYLSMYRENFVPWTDLAFIPALLNMVFETEAFFRKGLALLPVGVLVAVVTALLVLLLRGMRRSFEALPLRTGLIVVVAFGALSIPALLTPPTPPLSVRAVRQASRPEVQSFGDGAQVSRSQGESLGAQSASYALPGFKDRNVHLLIVESYGHTLFSNPEHRELIDPVYNELSTRLSHAGYHSYASFLVSPAFGGRSWLADATMLTGTFLDSQAAFDQMVNSGTDNLTHFMGRAGYHRLLAAPGTYEANDDWRSFYDFDTYLFRYDFGYNGPFVSFGAMPDQYLISRAHQSFKDLSGPVFATYILVSSHVPFDRVPPYVEDWSSLGDGSIYHSLGLREFNNNWLSGGEYPEGYVASIHYTLTSIVDYITRIANDDGLFIIVGDHQPRIPISEPSATFSVPVHVVSRDFQLVEAFSSFGFSRGFVPFDEGHHPRMDTLNTMVLAVARGNAAAYSEFTR